MDTADAITVVIATAAALIAGVAAFYAASQAISAANQARSADQQLELANQVRKDQAQPYVFADIRPDTGGFLMMLVVENTGATVAHNVRVKFEPELRSINFPDVSQLRFLREGISALPPGRRITWYFDTGPAIFENDVPKKYTVTIDAMGPYGAVDQLQYEIDFTVLENSEARNPGQLIDIANQLKKTNATLAKVAKTVETAVQRSAPPQRRPE